MDALLHDVTAVAAVIVKVGIVRVVRRIAVIAVVIGVRSVVAEASDKAAPMEAMIEAAAVEMIEGYDTGTTDRGRTGEVTADRR